LFGSTNGSPHPKRTSAIEHFQNNASDVTDVCLQVSFVLQDARRDLVSKGIA